MPDWDEIESWAETIAAVAEFGVTSMTFEYSGMGDSGDMEEWYITPEVALPPDLMETLTRMAWSATPPGFENNDGGQGTVDVDVAAQTVTLTHTDNYEEREDYEPDLIETYEWAPHDMVLTPEHGIPYPWRPVIEWEEPLQEQYGRAQSMLSSFGRTGKKISTALARFVRVFDPQRGIRLLNAVAYDPAISYRVTDDVKDAFLEAWERPPLIPRPLPAPDDVVGWTLLLLRVVGGAEYHVEVYEGDINDGAHSPRTRKKPDELGPFIPLPGGWTYPLGADLYNTYDEQMEDPGYLLIRADPRNIAVCEVLSGEFYYTSRTTDPEETLIYSPD